MQQQHSLPRHHARAIQPESSPIENTTANDLDLAASGSAVLLFGPGPSGSDSFHSQAQSEDTASTVTTTRDEWTILPAFERFVPLCPRRDSLTDSNSSGSQGVPMAGRSGTGGGESMSHSLFPSHNGNGDFYGRDMTNSLVLSEGSLYASGVGLDREEGSSLGRTISSGSSRNSTRSYAVPTTDRRTLSPSGTGTTFSSTSSSRPSILNYEHDSIGGSWALTEEALSTVPSALPHRETRYLSLEEPTTSQLPMRPPSVLPISDPGSSDDEKVYIEATSRGGTKVRYDEMETEEEDIALGLGMRLGTPRTPRPTVLDSKGKGKARISQASDSTATTLNSRESYPSPPPDSHLRSKRRHRESGKSGSQKKSSANGSALSESRSQRVRRIKLKVVESEESVRRKRGMEREEIERRKGEKQIFLGRFISRSLFEEDEVGDTMKMIGREDSTMEQTYYPSPSPSPSPTHAQSRSATPRPSKSPYRNRRNSTLASTHGFAALSKFAREELGEGQYHYGGVTAGEEEMMSEDEEEAEVDNLLKGGVLFEHSGRVGKYNHFRSRSNSRQPHRSPSLSDLLLHSEYLVDSRYATTGHSLASLKPSISTPTLPLSPTTPQRNKTRSRIEERERYGNSDEEGSSAWGGELEGLDAAISYWRRILRKMRGY